MDDPRLYALIGAAITGALTSLVAWRKHRDKLKSERESAFDDEQDRFRNELRSDVGRLQTRIESLQFQLFASQDQARDLRAQLATLTEDLAAARGQRDRLPREMDETRTELERARKRERSLAEEMHLLRRDLVTIRSERPPPKR